MCEIVNNVRNNNFSYLKLQEQKIFDIWRQEKLGIDTEESICFK